MILKTDAASAVADAIAALMRDAGRDHARFTEAALREMAGTAELPSGFLRGVRRRLRESGYLLHRAEGLQPTAGVTVVALAWLEQVPLLDDGFPNRAMV